MITGPARRSRAAALAGYALVALAAASWGTWPLILRAAERVRPMPAALESSVLMGVIALVSGPLLLRDRVPRRATAAQWVGVAWLGIADALNDLFFFLAYQKTRVAVAVLTHYLAPLLVALGAPIFLRERLGARAYVAAVVAFLGLVLLLQPWSAGARPGDALGGACGAASAFFYASNVIVNKRLTPAFSGSELIFYHCLVALPLLVLLVPHHAWSEISPRALTFVALGSLWAGALAGLLFVWGLRRIPASHASTLTLLEPLVAMLLGALVLGETVGPGGLLGAVLILTGAVLVVARPA